MQSKSPPRAVLFTQQVLGPGARKTGMIFWAEALARRGYACDVVTTQLSWLSRVVGNPRLKALPRDRLNRWRDVGARLRGFIWVPPLHPATVRGRRLARLTAHAFALYPWFLPATIRRAVAEADLVVIESCAAVLLFDRLKRIARPGTRFVYCGSDRLGAVDMHPMLAEALARTAAGYDLLRVPAQAMLADFPPNAPAMFIPHGIDRATFATIRPNPIVGPGRHAVVAGDMLFDHGSFAMMLDALPDVSFHAFGRMALGDLERRPNLRMHGEVPFETLIGWLQHADIGIAPYLDRPEAHYLAQSSLKLIQYRHCRLPSLAPHFAASAHGNVCGYEPGDASSIRRACMAALAMPRESIATGDIADWDMVIDRMLAATAGDDAGIVPALPG
ncbi:MAG: hypothetical protein ABW173_00420 [Sphingomonas sp.]